MAFLQLSLSLSLSHPVALVKTPSLIWVEPFHGEEQEREREQPDGFGLVSRNSPNTFTTPRLLQTGCKEELEEKGEKEPEETERERERE